MRSWLYQQQQRPDATTPLVPPVSDVHQGSIILSGRHVHRGASLLLTTTTDVLYDMYVCMACPWAVNLVPKRRVHDDDVHHWFRAHLRTYGKS